eukprot:TRINITY_DN34662_c0_g1_i1.p1 TRINITY_DN34662_c0_g1~~TRINITY_DN34662_c0_g1_i1.p1  ORF type:complete len:388 (-),score=53.64 TRINITY_DN34662_c0_g1_i1:142-1305(-)
MIENISNRFIFPAPESSYTASSYKRHLCWIPWNDSICQTEEERCGPGIPCLWFPSPKAASVLVFFHANAEDLGMCFAMLRHMRDQFKVNILAMEYPGYGLLGALRPSEACFYAVALTVFRYLVDEVHVRYSQIVLCGRSLGSGPAVHLASQYPVGGLILVSPFSSIKGAVRSIVGRFAAWSFGERFPNDRVIANVSCPTLFIHGEADELIPSEHSLKLFKRCRARKLLVTPHSMEHNSNLFGDASFFVVPAIHFFGFPGYYTDNPPRLPAFLFDGAEPQRSLTPKQQPLGGDDLEPTLGGNSGWFCGCITESDEKSQERHEEIKVPAAIADTDEVATCPRGDRLSHQKELTETTDGGSDPGVVDGESHGSGETQGQSASLDHLQRLL